MQWYWTILLFLAIGIYLFYRRRKVVKEFEERDQVKPEPRETEDDLIKGFQLLVVPKVTTRLKILKLHGKIFKSEEEIQNIDFRMDEATPTLATRSWDELGLSKIGKEIDTTLNNAKGDEVWTDIGLLNSNQVEKYYSFLEKFRSIIEDYTLTIPKRVEKVQSMTDPSGFLLKLYDEYGIDFPETIFIEKLAEIDGITKGVAKKLFENQIYTQEDLMKLSENELLSIDGVGPKRAKKILEST